MNETDLIAQLEKEYDKRENAELALKQIVEMCESYFKYGSRTEANSTRYGTIIKIAQEYFDNFKKEEKQDDNSRIQPKQG